MSFNEEQSGILKDLEKDLGFGPAAELDQAQLFLRVDGQPQTTADLVTALYEAVSNGWLSQDEFQQAQPFLDGLYLRDDAEAVIAELPRCSRPAAEYVVLRFPGSYEA